MSFKTGNFDIAHYHIINDADVNFKETSNINEWTAPVLHDCIRATIFNCYTLQPNGNIFERSYELLRLMLANGADPNSTDGYGNNALNRTFLDARQMIFHPQFNQSEKVLEQIRRVFKTLINAGADINRATEDRKILVNQITDSKMDVYKLFKNDLMLSLKQ
ncbi:MAG TPA: hypothetical protein VF676_09860 [Flavobacterium sp.]